MNEEGLPQIERNRSLPDPFRFRTITLSYLEVFLPSCGTPSGFLAPSRETCMSYTRAPRNVCNVEVSRLENAPKSRFMRYSCTFLNDNEPKNGSFDTLLHGFEAASTSDFSHKH